jgi:S-adenosylmethionine-dependent methyltransferase
MAPLTPEQVVRWLEYADAPWGRLRIELMRGVLERHVHLPPPRVLDAGCGLGELAVDFARAGSDVVAADGSEWMVAAARARDRDAPVRWVVADLDSAVSELAAERFDLVLCHNVLGYVADPADSTAALAELLAPGGTLSLTLANRAAEPLRLALLLRDLDAALTAAESCDRARVSGSLMTESRLDDLDEASDWLAAAGLELTTVAGLMLVNHYLGADDGLNRTADGYDAIRRLELALCEREPYLRVAPFLMLLARRPG